MNINTKFTFADFENSNSKMSEELLAGFRIKFFMKFKDASVLTETERKIIGYLQETLQLTRLNLTKDNARSFLTAVKLIENICDEENRSHRIDYKFKRTSYELRTWILALCSPIMDTCEVFTKTLNPDEMTNSSYLRNPNSWVAERVALHMHIVSTQYIHALNLSKRLNNEVPSVLAVRGQTGVGKTYSITHDPLFQKALDENGKPTGSVNPDYFKAFLKRITRIMNRLFLVNNQVHLEGFELCNRYMYVLATQAPNTSLVVDYTLTSIRQLRSNVLTPIQLRNGKAMILDIDAPILTSINHVFIREPYGVDPCVILYAIRDGFIDARKMRREVIEILVNDDRINYYKLYAHDSNGTRHLVAEKLNSKFIVHSEELFKESCTVPTDEEIDKQLKQIITIEYVERAIAKGDIPRDKRYMLDRWIGNTVEKALEMHIYNAPDQQAIADFCENALANRAVEIEQEESRQLPFPGKAARFIHESGDWSYLKPVKPLFHMNASGFYVPGIDPRGNSEPILRRNMAFRSTVPDSTISNFDILKYKDGSSVICIEFKGHGEEMARYLQSLDITLEPLNILEGRFYAKSDYELKTIFSIICKQNELPQDFMNFCIRALSNDNAERDIPGIEAILEKNALKNEHLHDQLKLHFSGRPAKFVHDRGDWSYKDEGTNLCRRMDFRSTVVNSTITSFCILGYKDGTSRIQFEFKGHGDEVARYLQSFNIVLDFVDKDMGFFTTRSRAEMKTIFAMLCKHNEIPQDKVQFCAKALKIES